MVNTVVLALLAELAGVHYLVAAVVATQASTLWNFSLTELWVFGEREHARPGGRRMAMFFAVNNVALALRAPLLVGLTAGLGIHYAVSNVLSLLAVFVARFALADVWIWGRREALAGDLARHNYDIHGLISVASDGRLPSSSASGSPSSSPATIRVRIGSVSRKAANYPLGATAAQNGNGNGNSPALDAASAVIAARCTYVEGRAGLGFAADIEIADGHIAVTASPLLKRSPHVLYTNVVEPILRWTFAEKGSRSSTPRAWPTRARPSSSRRAPSAGNHRGGAALIDLSDESCEVLAEIRDAVGGNIEAEWRDQATRHGDRSAGGPRWRAASVVGGGGGGDGDRREDAAQIATLMRGFFTMYSFV